MNAVVHHRMRELISSRLRLAGSTLMVIACSAIVKIERDEDCVARSASPTRPWFRDVLGGRFMRCDRIQSLVNRGSSMLRDLKRNWRRFKAGLPGRRFQQQFRYRQQFRSGPFRKVLFITGGILIATAGIFFLFAPGPGIIILLLGAVVIARESLLAARAFDWIEIQLRKFVRQRLKGSRRPYRR